MWNFFKMAKKVNKKVFVGISGGVDSAVAAWLLKEQGYEVVGVFIKTWSPDFIECTWKTERRDAMRVCAHLNIPFLECDATKEYKNGVADYMIEEYKKGRTPNPDVMCNREVKFGVFWNFAKNKGADFIATGHYVKLLNKNDHFYLAKNKDQGKDQVYFLWTLNNEDLKHCLFPIGDIDKKEVRRIAKKIKLPNAFKKDSQGVCFLGKLDMKDFLKHYIEIKRGDVLNEEGLIVGSHEGATFFTIGERHGFFIDKKFKKNKPLYVISKNLETNTIVVSEKSPIERKTLDNIDKKKIINCNNLNLNSDIQETKKYQAQIRYHGLFVDCFLKKINEKSLEVFFEQDISVDSGQSVVFYDNEICVGGGVVV